ncbi:MAG: hypothetical protein A2516_07755 [Alphaproteobacteria bacterium RIFOXYD12_FULL_60_8]|nr:MAG: hypothetical protein A2516_07755 [Alphaproteobacteria bacterium RIFOXYD12_FULL_60_8]
MAKKETPKQTNQAASVKSSGKAGVNNWALIVIGVIIFVVFFPTMVVFCVGMFPTFIAFFIERSKKGMVWISVGCMNLVGVTPYIMDLWLISNTPQQALDTVFSVFPWLVWYSTAGLGWLIYLGTPPVVGIFLTLAAASRASTLKASQRRLVEKWGQEVSGNQEGAGPGGMMRGE